MKKNFIWLVLVLALAARLYHIGFPVGGFQAWRQADTAAMARNFYEHGFNFFCPQIDWGGNGPGYVETEFPLYSFLVALLYKVFFPADTWGRLLSIFCALVTIFGLYLLVRKYLGENIARWSAMVYAFIPLNIYYTQAFMPESMMLMSSVLGVYFFSEWMDRRGVADFILSAIFVALAVLLKIPALYLGLPLLFLAVRKYGKATLLQWELWLYAVLVLVPVALWYYHAHQIYLQSNLTFGIWMFGTDKWGILAPLGTLKFYNDIFFKSIAERHLTYAGFIPFVIGLFIKRKTKEERLFDWWLIAIVVYFAIVAVGNQVHEYYQLPFVLPAVVYVGKAFDKYLALGPWKTAGRNARLLFLVFLLCVIGIPILSSFRIANFRRGENAGSWPFQLAAAVQSRTATDNLVVAVDEHDPFLLYCCRRKGWHADPCALNEKFLQEKVGLGAKYLLGGKGSFTRSNCPSVLKALLQEYPIIIETEEFFLLTIERK